jgi:hypothetical protein
MTIGALGFITKESISNKVEEVSKEFPIAVFFGIPNYKPLNIKLPYKHELSMCIQEIKESDLPKKESGLDIRFGKKIYFEAMQYLIVKEIFKQFSQGWNVIAKQMYRPGGKTLSWQSLGDTGKEIQIDDVLKSFTDNYFMKDGVRSSIHDPFSSKAVFPPSIEISIENSDDQNQTVINLDTNYITVSITLTQSSSTIGIGEYSQLLGLTTSKQYINLSEPQQYGNAVFLLGIKTKQNFWLNGHPDMKIHRNWANAIIELLDSTFNYELIREEHLRQFQIYGADAIRDI